MRISWLWVLLLVWMVFLASGCANDIPALVDSLARDQATACVTIVSSRGTIKLARTGLKHGKVSCTADGMELSSGGE